MISEPKTAGQIYLTFQTTGRVGSKWQYLTVNQFKSEGMLGSCTWLLSLAAPKRISETSKKHSLAPLHLFSETLSPLILIVKRSVGCFHEETAVLVKTVHNEACGLSQYTLKLCLEVKAAVDVFKCDLNCKKAEGRSLRSHNLCK